MHLIPEVIDLEAKQYIRKSDLNSEEAWNIVDKFLGKISGYVPIIYLFVFEFFVCLFIEGFLGQNQHMILKFPWEHNFYQIHEIPILCILGEIRLYVNG